MIYKLAENRVCRTYKGGAGIDAFTGRKCERDGFYPEDWTASTVCAKSPDGRTEGYGIAENGQTVSDIVGSEGLPILVKLLDAGERLAVQVHPTVEFARKHLDSLLGKTECWYMLGCDEDACVYLGFGKGITREKWKSAVLDGGSERILSMLCEIPVKKGDFVFVGGGIVHAIGKGCFLAELQEPSDITLVAEEKTASGGTIPKFRRDCGLGLDKALDMYDYTGFTEDEVRSKYVFHPEIVRNGVTEVCGRFLTDKFSMVILNGNAVYKVKRKYAVAITVSGEGCLCGEKTVCGDRFLIPCGDLEKKRITSEGNGDFTVILCE